VRSPSLLHFLFGDIVITKLRSHPLMSASQIDIRVFISGSEFGLTPCY